MEAPPEVAEEFCLWRLYLLDEAEEIKCGSLGRFMLLLASEGTAYVTARPNFYMKRCEATVYGPLCDDATIYSTEKEGRLRATYMLTAEIVHNRFTGLSQDEKRNLIEMVRKKGKGVSMKLFCDSLNLPRVI